MEYSISVAMCTCNGEKYVYEQLKSILNQTVPPDEIVICDDVSDDSTRDIIGDMIKEYPGKNIRLYKNEGRLGIAHNFFKALSLCTGEIVFFSDQDDVWMPDRVAVFRDAFKEEPECSAVLSDAVLTDEKLNSLERTLWESLAFTAKWRKSILKGDAHKVLGRQPFVTGAALAIRRERFQDLDYPKKSNILHDEWLGWFINNDMVFVERPTFYYRQHDIQAVGAHFFSGFKEHAEYISGIMKEAEQSRFPSIDEYQVLECALIKKGVNKDIIQCIKGKIDFMKYCKALPLSRIPRLFYILFKGGRKYSLYSNGVKGMIKDIVRKVAA